MPFNLQKALEAGKTEDEIYNYLTAANPSFNAQKALETGKSKREILDYLSVNSKPPVKNVEPVVNQANVGTVQEQPQNIDFQSITKSILDQYNAGNFSQRKVGMVDELKKRGVFNAPMSVASLGSDIQISDTPIFNNQGTQEKQSFSESVTSDINDRTKKLGEFIGRQDSLSDIPAIGAVTFGQAIGGVEDIVGELVSRGISAAVPEPVKEKTIKTLVDFSKTKVGQMGLDAFKKGSEAYNSFEGKYPDAGMALRSMLNIFGASLAIKTAGSLQIGKELIDSTGKPTRALTKILEKKGLDFESLSKEAIDALPNKIDTGILEDITAKTIAEESLKKQIQSGATDGSLAKLTLKGEKLVNDKLAGHTIKQGFTPGFVQAVKASSPATKENMQKMSSIMRRIKKNERLGLDMRPSDIIGDSVTERIKFIRGKSNSARLELNEIAKTKLKGQPIETEGVLNTLKESLDDLDIRFKKGKTGSPEPYFKGSLISKDRSSQKVIRDLMDLMAEGGKPDALRFHKLKRQLDTMLDYNKKSAMGLSDAGKRVLKDVRRSLNKSLRASNPDYARVNDIMSKSLNAIGDLDKSMGTMDIFGEGSNKAIGQRMRALLSNQQGRIKMNNALNDIESVSNDLGGKFDDDIKDLVMFADGLDNRFGTIAKTSFAGQTTQGVTEAMRHVKPSVLKTAVSVVEKGIGKVKGVTDNTSFEALDRLLRRK